MVVGQPPSLHTSVLVAIISYGIVKAIFGLSLMESLEAFKTVITALAQP